ncbi:MAG: hypothetical protein JW891_18485 [Candidatus Lokiarchaeota archaeon]|nr:hypothetical protein [Candidatus Lokiarchaeota archaeon]
MIVDPKPKSKAFDWISTQMKKGEKLEFERLGNWVIAGSGNYEKTQIDGRYRESCNTYRGAITCEHHKTESLTPQFTRCRKFDCETCFPAAASEKARDIEQKLLSFKESAMDKGIDIGNYASIVLTYKAPLTHLKTYDAFKKLRRKAGSILKSNELLGGVIINHAWVLKCGHCNRKLAECQCEQTKLKATINHHFHAIGFGFLTHSKEFQKRNPGWVYVNHGRRKSLHETLFYCLSHCALWRKPDGKLYPAYAYFGWLSSRKCRIVDIKTSWRAVRCGQCKKELREITDGLSVSGDLPFFPDNTSLKTKAKKLGIAIEGKTPKKIKLEIQKRVVNNQNFNCSLDESRVRFGNLVKYRIVSIAYEIADVQDLRILINQLRAYRKRDRKRAIELAKLALKATGEYG